jgi:hypothetical protein
MLPMPTAIAIAMEARSPASAPAGLAPGASDGAASPLAAVVLELRRRRLGRFTLRGYAITASAYGLPAANRPPDLGEPNREP